MRYFLIVLIGLMFGCSTPKPEEVKESVVTEVISFDGNEQNGGIIDFMPNLGWIITPNAAKKYVNLIELYGKIFLPPLEGHGGLEPFGKNFLLSQEKMIKFAQMNQRWKIDRK
jgi:hypothetical protein